MTETAYQKYGKKSYEKNKEKNRERMRQYYQQHKEEIKEKSKEYYKMNKEAIDSKKKQYDKKRYREGRHYVQKPLSERKCRKGLDFDTPYYITVKQYPNSIILIEANWKTEEGILFDPDVTNEEYHRKKELERIVNKYVKTRTIIIAEKYEVQIYVQPEEMDRIQLIINDLDDFVQKKIKKVA